EEGQHAAEERREGEDDHPVVAVRPVVEETAGPGAEGSAEPLPDDDGAEDRRHGAAAEELHGDRRDERTAGAERAAEADDEGAEQNRAREAAEQPEKDDARQGETVAEKDRAAAADDSIEPTEADHADGDENAGDAPGRRRLEGREADGDEIS